MNIYKVHKDIAARMKSRIKRALGWGMVLLCVYDQSPAYFCVTARGSSGCCLPSEEPLTPKVSAYRWTRKKAGLRERPRGDTARGGRSLLEWVSVAARVAQESSCKDEKKRKP
jgi:hypothetical protein